MEKIKTTKEVVVDAITGELSTVSFKNVEVIQKENSDKVNFSIDVFKDKSYTVGEGEDSTEISEFEFIRKLKGSFSLQEADGLIEAEESEITGHFSKTKELLPIITKKVIISSNLFSLTENDLEII